MKKFFSFVFMALVALTLVSCNKDKDDDGVASTTSNREALLKKAVVGQVDGHIIPIYTALADTAMLLKQNCDSMLAAFQAKHPDELAAQQMLAKENWEKARQLWERSESFLFGPVEDNDVDPHIDSWPLNKTEQQNLIDRLNADEELTVAVLASPYGTTGFHSLEYMIYDPTNADPANIKLRDPNNYTLAELKYMALVAKDLASQTALLKGCWMGKSELLASQISLLDELKVEDTYGNFNNPYRYFMTKLSSTTYKTYQFCAETIIQGCIDIADEVGNKKIGMPNTGSSEKDRNYIESPYALNSIKDFQDNITSIKNSYEGVNGAYSISDYVKSKNAALDKEVRAAIDASIEAIGKINEPFILPANAQSDAATNAVKLTGTDLVKVLEKVNTLLSDIE